MMAARLEMGIHAQYRDASDVLGVWSSSPLRLTINSSSHAFAQFPLRLIPGTTVTAAQLVLTPDGDSADLSALKIASIAALASLAMDQDAAAVIEEDEVAPDAWVDGEAVTLDVTQQVAAALAHASYATMGAVTLRIGTDSLLTRSCVGWRSSQAKAAKLIVTYTEPAREPDPITLVYRTLWAMLKADPVFAAQVKVGNRIEVDGEAGNPFKPDEVVAEADLPEVSIVPMTTLHQLRNTTSSTSMVLRFGVDVITGLRTTSAVNRLRWAILGAMSMWPEFLLDLRWAGKQFVVNCEANDGTTGMHDDDKNKTIKGWSLVMVVDVHVRFETGDI